MEMKIDFPGGDRVDAHIDPLTISTDQIVPYVEGANPAPFDLFLASIGTCAGIYVLRFCRSRNIPTDDIRIVQRAKRNGSAGMIARIELEIQVPPDFPEKYYGALVRSANQCAVKRHLEAPPEFETYTKVIG